MKDFTFALYKELLEAFLSNKYKIQTYEDFINSPKDRVVILRHDVDRRAQNSLATAKIENELGVQASYYFRIVPASFNPIIINEIKTMRHEIGYHYENLSKKNGDYEEAIKDFDKNLDILKKFFPIKTICMHGSPMSNWDNRDLWDKYSYKDYGIIGEPYFDIDFNRIFYITDAGRSWNNIEVSIRDKISSKHNISINSTNDIIQLINSTYAPDQIMINVHPHNWAINNYEWWKILIWQNFKNLFKRVLIKIK